MRDELGEYWTVRPKRWYFDVLKKQTPRASGEVQLPDAIDVVAKRRGMKDISIYCERLRVIGGLPGCHQARLSRVLNRNYSDYVSKNEAKNYICR